MISVKYLIYLPLFSAMFLIPHNYILTMYLVFHYWIVVCLFFFFLWCAVKVLVAPSYSTLCDLMDCSPSGSSLHGILQARILEWEAIPFSRRSSIPEIEHRFPTLQAACLPSEPPGKPMRCSIISLKIMYNIFMLMGTKSLGQSSWIGPMLLLPLLSRFSRVRLWATP